MYFDGGRGTNQYPGLWQTARGPMLRKSGDGGDAAGDGPGGAAGAGSGGNGGDSGGTGGGEGGGEATTQNQPVVAPTAVDPGLGGTNGADNRWSSLPGGNYQDSPFIDSLGELSRHLSDRARNVYEPLEDRLIKTRERFSSPEYAQEQIAAAKGDVTKAFADRRTAADADAASLGIDPTNPRRAAMRRSLDIAQAGATAGAGTMTRRAVEAQDYNSLAGLANMGDQKTARSIGAATAGGNMFMEGQGLNARQLMQGRELDSGEFRQWRDLMYRKDQANQQAEDNGMAGIGSLVGTGLGIAAMFL